MWPDILILAHRHDRLFDAPLDSERGFTGGDASEQRYTIYALANLWRQLGLNVRVKRGASPFSTARAGVAINHVSLTLTPAPYLNYLRRFPIVLNRDFTDTSKSKYCRGLLSPEDSYDGPVIVKTDLNFGGKIEHKLQKQKQRSFPLRYLRLLRRPMAGASTHMDPLAYPILDHPSRVPNETWGNPYLIVQKFQPERDDAGLYRLRSWYVFGDRGFHVLALGKEPIVKGGNMVRREVIDINTLPEMEVLRKQMRVDYGRFDYALVDGKAVVYDINRTPTITAASETQYASQLRDLAQGIVTFLS